MTEATPDVPNDAWSGVHRGPLRAGEWVRLVDGKGRKHNFELVEGKRFFSNKGHLDHDELIGREEGFAVTSSVGGEYLVFRPLLSEFVVSMPRGAAQNLQIAAPSARNDLIRSRNCRPWAVMRSGFAKSGTAMNRTRSPSTPRIAGTSSRRVIEWISAMP